MGPDGTCRLGEVHRLAFERDVAGVSTRQREQPVDQMGQAVRLLEHAADDLTVGHRIAGLAQSDLAETARAVRSHLGVLAEEKQQSLTVNASAPVVAFADRAVIRQALVNLVDNAIKYTPVGGCIGIAVRDGQPGLTIEVTDTGPGIAWEHREHVFDRFYRVDKARSRDSGGTGLGLAIARWAVEAHGGALEVDSTEGCGSTFRIRLPHSDQSRRAPRSAAM
jgi:signal transduction histidine kinase